MSASSSVDGKVVSITDNLFLGSLFLCHHRNLNSRHRKVKIEAINEYEILDTLAIRIMQQIHASRIQMLMNVFFSKSASHQLLSQG